MNKVINNTSKGFFKKLFNKNHIEKMALSEEGFVIFLEKEEEILLSFKEIKAVKSNFYLDKITPYRTVTILMDNQKKYNMNVSPEIEEINSILKHYAKYQLGGDIPDNICDIHVVLQHGVNNYKIRLENV